MRYMTSDDLAARLRLYANASIEGSWSAVFKLDLTIAADEIERLRNERNAFEAERDELIRISNKLKRERDEARREVCNNEANHLPTMADPHREAKRRGWDCFKEAGDER